MGTHPLLICMDSGQFLGFECQPYVGDVREKLFLKSHGVTVLI